MGSTELPPGGGPVTITYAAQGVQVAALQFDLTSDSSTMSRVLIGGSALRAAYKFLSFADLPLNRRRVLIAGLNQTVINDGPLLTVLVLVKTASLADLTPLP